MSRFILTICLVFALMRLGHAKEIYPIKALIFDVGNVIVTDDLRLWTEAFKNIGAEHPERLLSDLQYNQQGAYIEQFGRGEITPDIFMPMVAKRIGLKGWTKESFMQAWNAPIIKIDPKIVGYLKQWRAKGFPIFALSNNNLFHAQAIDALFQKKFPIHGHFYQLFDHHYWSYETGLRKPEPLAWLQITQAHGLSPQECLYIDDQQAFLDLAQGLGFQTLAYSLAEPPERLAQKLTAYLQAPETHAATDY